MTWTNRECSRAVAVLALLAVTACSSGTASDTGPGAGGQSPTVTVSPPSITLGPGGTQGFAATVTGTADLRIVWSVQEAGGGTISPSGVPTTASATYTAPAATGTYHVVATSAALPAVSGSATINVANTGTVGDAPAWMASLPALSNGLPWDPGVPGGIPAGTLDATLSTVTASTINSAISAASGRGSPTNIRVVQLPAGTFSITGNIVPQNYVILRGAGPWGSGRTRLNFSAGVGIESNDTAWGSVPITTMALAAGGSLPVGSKQVQVGSATGFAVGDLIQLDQLDDLSYVNILDAGYEKRAPFTDGPYHGPISPDGFRSVGSVHQITAISGTTLTFDPPTRIEYDYYSKADGTTRLDPQVWRVSRRGTDGLWWFGLESMSIAGPQNGAIIYHVGAFDWVKDVETDGSANGGISNDHIRLEHQFRSEVRRVYAHNTTGGPYSGGANYGINLNAYTSECLVIDSISTYMNKPMQTNCAGPGNVIAYNYVDNTSANGGAWMDGAINGSHQSFTHHLLVEGNWSANIGCDTTHGNSGFMAFLRNYSPGHSTNYSNNSNLRAANTDGWQREMVFAGNVLDPPGGAVYEATGQTVGGQYSVWSIGQMVWGSGDDWDANAATGGATPTQNTVIGGVSYPPRNAMSYSGTTWDGRQATFNTKAKSTLWRHGNWDSVHGAIFDWNAGFPAHDVAASWFLTSAPAFFSGNAWPWINPTGATAAARVGTLPAKARYDAGTPFSP